MVIGEERRGMSVAVGVDVAKKFHWATAVEELTDEVLLSRRVENDPSWIEALFDDLSVLRANSGSVRVGIDVVGGIAGLLVAMLVEAGFQLVHVPGLAVNRARQGTTGGETRRIGRLR